MPEIFNSAIAAGIHCDKLNAIDHDGKGGLAGHAYLVAIVPALKLRVVYDRDADKRDEGELVLTDERLSALAAV